MKLFAPLLLTFLTPVILLGYHETKKLREGTGKQENQNVLRINHFSDNVTGILDSTENQPDSADTIVPVELVSFFAQVRDHHIILSWQTASESNAMEFEILHCTDGITWRSLALLQAAGNSQALRSYSFTHATPVNGVNIYRLIQRDYDGTENVDRTITVNRDNRPSYTVFPNPVIDRLLHISSDIRTYMTIYDLTGEMLGTIQLDEGTNIAPLGAFPSGNYFIRIGGYDGDGRMITLPEN